MGSDKRRVYSFTVCVRDDDERVYEFQTTGDSTALSNRVAAAIATGRRVRWYLLAADPDAQDREARYLEGKGYARRAVHA